MKKFSTLAMVAALTTAMAIPAFASQSVAVSSDGSFVLTVDTTGVFTTAEDEYAHAWFQTYGADITITKVTIVVGGEEVDVTSYAVLDGSDGNYTTYILDGDVDSYFADSSTLDTVTAINYYVTAASTDFDNNWIGGAVGYQCVANSWYSAGQWTSSAEADDSGKEYYLSLSDASTETTDDTSTTEGDTAPVAYLAAVVALAGVALVASKKVRA